MKKKVIQVVLTVALGFIFSSGVMIIEKSSSSNSFANNENYQQIQVVDRLGKEPFDPPPPPPPPGG